MNAGFRLQFLKVTPGDTHKFLQGLQHHFLEASNGLVQLWLKNVQGSSGSAEILTSTDVKGAAVNVMSRAAFGADVAGTTPLEAASKVFQTMDQLTAANASAKNTFPATDRVREANVQDTKFIDNLIEEIKDARIQAVRSASGARNTTTGGVHNEDTAESGHDLVGIMVDAMLGGSKTMTKGQLAHHTEWQVKAREEVRSVTGNTGILDADGVNKLHILGMILHEVLRLYPAAPLPSREAVGRHKLGDLDILPGTNVLVPVPVLHLDEKYWDKPLAFKPERFENGVGAACLNRADAFLPFGGGPRICIGPNFALMEAKTLIACILHRFSLQVSPRYQHCPGPVNITSADSVLLLVKELKAS